MKTILCAVLVALLTATTARAGCSPSDQATLRSYRNQVKLFRQMVATKDGEHDQDPPLDQAAQNLAAAAERLQALKTASGCE